MGTQGPGLRAHGAHGAQGGTAQGARNCYVGLQALSQHEPGAMRACERLTVECAEFALPAPGGLRWITRPARIVIAPMKEKSTSVSKKGTSVSARGTSVRSR